MAEGTYWDCERAEWVPSPPTAELPEQRMSLEDAEEADVRSG
jgi:hypothetical protein